MSENTEKTPVSGLGGAAIGAIVGSIIGGPITVAAAAVAGGILGPKYLSGVAEKLTEKVGGMTGRTPR